MGDSCRTSLHRSAYYKFGTRAEKPQRIGEESGISGPDGNDAKHFIGQKFDDPSVTEGCKRWPFEVIRNGDKPKIRGEFPDEQKLFSSEEISSIVFRLLMLVWAKIWRVPWLPSMCISMTVKCLAPPDSGAITKMNVLCAINEPIAVAIVYGLDRKVGG